MVLKVQPINLEPGLKPDPASQALAMQTTVELPSTERPVYKIGPMPPPDRNQVSPIADSLDLTQRPSQSPNSIRLGRELPSQRYVNTFERHLAEYEKQVDLYNVAVDLYNAGQGIDPGDFGAVLPTFEQERYSALLLSEFEQDLAGQKAQFDLIRKAEEEKYDEQLKELQKEQDLLAEENRKAQAAAENAQRVAQEQAAGSRTELERRRRQFTEETETLQRNTGAQRAGFVRARRLRNRPLLAL